MSVPGDAPASDPGQRPSSHHAGEEPIPGYCLIAPLGKGGFGEVWKCEAPGGFHKAIKFVRGISPEGNSQGWLAEQEIKAIELMKNIRHPFILTVERAEFTAGTLMIVMELADRSTGDRLLECKGNGLPGIPRDELLRYMAEAAEALDLMNFQHGLQHLDIKPQNLFLVSDHVKVADFGLVNRLPKPSDPNASKVQGAGGITPRYVAPEVLRQRISRRSDQYSLAIVYQELLTGTMPFKGKNGRQLMMQHLQAQPDLAALPEGDRVVIGRALAKDPEERYASCRDFVRALTLSEAREAPARPAAGAVPRQTDPAINLSGKTSLEGLKYGECLGRTPLGEFWQMMTEGGETCWAAHLHRFTLESAPDQEKALTYLQSFRHPALLRFKIAELMPHRIVLIYEPWGPSLRERSRARTFSIDVLMRALTEAAHSLDELTAQTNLEHLTLSPDTIVQGLDGEQLRDFGMVSSLWKSGREPLDAVNPRYGAPELAQGRASSAADQYSLAAVYADLRSVILAGKPCPSPTAGTKARPSTIDISDIPVPERRVLQKALHADPDARYGSCGELLDALADALGGAVSTTTAVRSALLATQQSFLDMLDEWITRQMGEVSPSPDDLRLRHVCNVEIVPGTAKLRLGMFQQQWNAQIVSASANEFHFFMPLGRTLFQRLFAAKVGVEAQVLLRPIDGASPLRNEAVIEIRAVGCKGELADKFRESIAPEILDSCRKCLNAMPERRGYERIAFRASVSVRHRARGRPPTEHSAEAMNISRGGIGFTMGGRIEPSTEIRILLGLPQKDQQPVPVLVKAAVRRCTSLPEGKFELAAEFLREADKTTSSASAKSEKA